MENAQHHLMLYTAAARKNWRVNPVWQSSCHLALHRLLYRLILEQESINAWIKVDCEFLPWNRRPLLHHFQKPPWGHGLEWSVEILHVSRDLHRGIMVRHSANFMCICVVYAWQCIKLIQWIVYIKTTLGSSKVWSLYTPDIYMQVQ